MDVLVSVVIPSFNGRNLLADCLSPVEKAAWELPAGCIEIVVVDDASTDGTDEWLARWWPRVRCIRLEDNGGFAAAANAGIAATRGRWVAVLNNDTAVAAKWISAAARHFGHKEIGCVASRIAVHGSDITESAGDGYTIAGLAYQGENGFESTGRSDAYTTFSACAAAAFYRRRALDEVGVFEERFESYYEDVDLGFRLNLYGWQTVCVPQSICYHIRGGSYGKHPWRMIRNSARNSEIVYFSCMPRALLLRSLPAHAATLVAQGCLRALQGRLLPFLAGKLAFVAHIPWIIRRRRRIQQAAGNEAQLADLIDQEWFSIHVARRVRALGKRTRTIEASLSG